VTDASSTAVSAEGTLVAAALSFGDAHLANGRAAVDGSADDASSDWRHGRFTAAASEVAGAGVWVDEAEAAAGVAVRTACVAD